MDKRQTDIQIQLELNRRMYARGLITREIYGKAQEILLKAFNTLINQLKR